MSLTPFIGEIAMLPFTFAPVDYAYCAGQLMPISQNQALYAVIGSTFGGDWRTTMATPNLKARAPIGQGQGPGLTPRELGGRYGTTQEPLTQDLIPSHDHNWKSLDGAPNSTDGNVPENTRVTANFAKPKGARMRGQNAYVSSPASYTSLSPQTVSTAGQSHSHNNMQPFLGLNYFLATYGEFPARN